MYHPSFVIVIIFLHFNCQRWSLTALSFVLRRRGPKLLAASGREHDWKRRVGEGIVGRLQARDSDGARDDLIK